MATESAITMSVDVQPGLATWAGLVIIYKSRGLAGYCYQVVIEQDIGVYDLNAMTTVLSLCLALWLSKCLEMGRDGQ